MNLPRRAQARATGATERERAASAANSRARRAVFSRQAQRPVNYERRERPEKGRLPSHSAWNTFRSQNSEGISTRGLFPSRREGFSRRPN